MLRAEDIAQTKRCKYVALRAADPLLLGYYRKLGYTRRANACLLDSRVARRRLRELDRNAVSFKGDILSNGTQQHARWLEDQGWWMTKCINKKAIAARTKTQG